MGLNETQKKERSEYLEDNLKITECSQNKEYVFISYASSDWETVFKSVVVPFHHEYGLRIYADKAFDQENDRWIIPMLRNIRRAQAVIAFISQNFIESYACFLEILTAVHSEVPIVFVSIERDLKLGSTNIQPRIEIGVKTEIIHRGDDLATKTNNTSKDVMRAMKSAYTSLSTLLQQDALSVYDISDAFINFFRDASVNMKTINDKIALKRTIESVNNKVFDAATINLSPEKTPEPVPEKTPEPVPVKTPEPVPVKTPEPVPVKTPEPVPVCPIPTENKKGKSSTGDITYTIYGREYTDNQADMMLNVFAKVLKRHPDAVAKILEEPEKPKIACASAINYNLAENRTNNMPSYFRNGLYLEIGGGIYIGTALKYTDKLRNIAHLLIFCGEDYSVLQSEQIELPETVKIYGDETYSIYGKKYSGTQSKMMIDVLKFLMEKHFDKREELSQLLSIELVPLSELSVSSYFRISEEFTYQGVTYSIGAAFNRAEKLNQISKAIAICGEDIDHFEIDGLDEVIKAKAGRPGRPSAEETYSIYGKKYSSTQGKMMINVLKFLMEKHFDKRKELSQLPSIELVPLSELSVPSYFKVGEEFTHQGVTYSIGATFKRNEKLNQISKAIAICGEDIDHFEIDGLDEVIKAKAGRPSAEETYSIYGKKYSGTQSKMMIDVLKFLMEKHFDKREELSQLLSIKLAPLRELSVSSYFRISEEFTYQSVTYSIGAAFNRAEKLNQISKAIAICGEDVDHFEIDGLDEAIKAKAGRPGRSSVKRDFLND